MDKIEFKVRLIDCIARGESPLFDPSVISTEEELMDEIKFYGLQEDEDVRTALLSWKVQNRLNAIQNIIGDYSRVEESKKKRDLAYEVYQEKLGSGILDKDLKLLRVYEERRRVYDSDEMLREDKELLKAQEEYEREMKEIEKAKEDYFKAREEYQDKELSYIGRFDMMRYALETGAWTDERVMQILNKRGFSEEFIQQQIASGEFPMHIDEKEETRATQTYSWYLSEGSQDLVKQAIEQIGTQITGLTDLEERKDYFTTVFDNGEEKYRVDYLYREDREDVDNEQKGRDTIVIHRNGKMIGLQMLPDEMSVHGQIREKRILLAENRIDKESNRLEKKNQKFLESLEDPDIELILLTQNGIEYIREGYNIITGARMVPTPGTYYDMLCTYKDGQYVDCIPYPVFLAKGGDIARIDSFGELLHTGTYTYEESIEHGTWTRLNEGITALKVGMIIGAAYGDTLEERYSYLQPIVDQVAGMDLESPETEEKISKLVEELEYSVANPENDYAYLDDAEDARVARQTRRNGRPKEYRKPSGLAHKDAILTQLYDKDKQLGALQPEKSTGKDDKAKPKSEEESK